MNAAAITLKAMQNTPAEEFGSIARMQYGISKNDDVQLYDAFVTITDPTGVKFKTGGGAVGEETMNYYKNVVESH